MYMRKFFVLFVLGACMRLSAMDQGSVVVAVQQMPQQEKFVQGVVMQVYPGFITGTCIVQQKSRSEIALHEAALSLITQQCKAINLIPVKDMGLWHMTLPHPVSLEHIKKLCAALPGLETVHDVKDYADDKTGLKEAIFETRLQQLDENERELKAQKRRDEKLVRLVTLKKLSKGHGALPKEDLVAK